MEFVPIVALAALVGKLVDFLKYAGARDRNGVFTQLTAWTAGVGGVFLFSASDFGAGIDIGGQTLTDMNGFSKTIVGLMATSLFSTFHDVKKAIDNTDSAVTPTLVPDPTTRSDAGQLLSVNNSTFRFGESSGSPGWTGYWSYGLSNEPVGDQPSQPVTIVMNVNADVDEEALAAVLDQCLGDPVEPAADEPESTDPPTPEPGADEEASPTPQ